MAGIDEKFISEIKSKNNIVDIVGRYCVLKRKGSNYWACCPLDGHNEKTPSFSVNESGQFYHCFGCGKGGDVIKFIEEVESLDFYESVKFLADNAKIPMPEDDSSNDENSKKLKEKKDRLYDILKDTALYYVSNLKSQKGEKAKKYLLKRGITSQTATAFGLGVSVGYNEVVDYLKSKGYSNEDILDSGVCQKNNKGYLFDAYANRLIVPIINSLGKVIAFGGRVLEKSEEGFGKYKNTQDTQIFSKKRNLFAINNLKNLKKQTNFSYVIMVEGYMDAISLYQAGFKNVVASMGTSLTLEQAKLLKRYTDKVVVSFDGDAAGQKATLRSLSIFEDEGFEVRVINLPNGKDPDEVINEYGVNAYQKLIDDAEPLIDFKLRAISFGKNLKDASDRRKYVLESLQLIKTVKDAFVREELLKKLRDKSGITYESLKRDLDGGKILTEEPNQEVWVNPQKSGNNEERAERFVLNAVIENRPYVKDFMLDDLYFANAIRNKIAEQILDDPYFRVENLSSIIGEENLEELNAVLTAGENIFDTSFEEKYFNDCVIQIKKSNIENKIKRLNEEYQKETDIEKRREIASLITKETTKLMDI
ncbi:MAG: DNA primase [Clostridia bacterium]|nr:DNA primase [Clostridia bacterium]